MKIIFDLDETVIDSKHRTPNNPDGTLNLAAYRANHNRKNVFKDKLLPLAKTMRKLHELGHEIIILTARDMAKFDYDYLNFHNLKFTKILSRDNADTIHYSLPDGEYKAHWILKAGIPVDGAVMFEDSPKVKSALRKMGLPVLCAHKINRKLKK